MKIQVWEGLITLASLQLGVSAETQVPTATDSSLLWGPYRPNVYFGMRPRIPESLLMGLMWVQMDDDGFLEQYLRHSSDHNEGLAGFDWHNYDPRTGGVQTIRDVQNQVDMTTEVFKPADNEACCQWGVRISGTPRVDAPKDNEWLMVFYIGTEERNPADESFLACDKVALKEAVNCYGRFGNQPKLQNFTLHVRNLAHRNDKNLLRHKVRLRSDTIPPDGVWQAETIYTSHVHSGTTQKTNDGTLYFIEKRFEGSFQFEILFSSNRPERLMDSTELTKGLAKAKSAFSERFKATFTPKPPFHASLYITFLETTLSNLLGSIGYFYGDSQADLSSHSEYEEKDSDFWEKVAQVRSKEEPTFSDRRELFSTGPSRAVFPRGFLWDEGFHILVVLQWDLDLAMEIVQSWLGLMNDDGWIEREQILGSEARSRVAPKFRTQYPQHANPPTLFMVVSAFTDIISGNRTYNGHPSRHLAEPSLGLGYLKTLYPLLHRYYEWFRNTQAGDMESNNRSNYSGEGYRWRGRTPNHTLPSGLDDYPRAEPPHPGELHIDALSWVGVMARVMKQISECLGETDDHLLYTNHESAVKRSIEALHWSEEHQIYCDATLQDGDHSLVCHKGYMSLYPFFLGLLESTHPHLKPLLDLINNKTELWSPHGIRSLSKQDEHYGTEENYWRSPVWVNINFLILEQLLVLAQTQGPHQDQAREMYIALRKNLVTTVYNSWRQSGHIWEHYNADTGSGGGASEFTGWTALIVKIAAMPDLRKRGIHTIVDSTREWSLSSHAVVSSAILAVFLFIFRRRVMRTWTSVFSK